jgi:hypothetical protein
VRRARCRRRSARPCACAPRGDARAETRGTVAHGEGATQLGPTRAPRHAHAGRGARGAGPRRAAVGRGPPTHRPASPNDRSVVARPEPCARTRAGARAW